MRRRAFPFVILAIFAGVLFGSVQAQTPSGQLLPPDLSLPVQRWWHKDPALFMLVPKAAAVSNSGNPLGSLMSPGWRLVWDGAQPAHGELLARFSLSVVPMDGMGTETEVLQIGVSRDPAGVESCQTQGLKEGAGRQESDCTINGHRFVIWSNQHSGMNQAIAATDLRAVVDGTCYAIERFSYSVKAVASDPSVTLSEDAGSKALDAAVASMRFGPVRAGNVLVLLHN